MPQCAVPGCTKQNGLMFPKDNDMVTKWVIAIKREQLNCPGKLWIPNKTARICPIHFTSADYESQNIMGDKPKKRVLKKCAVPSLHLPTSSKVSLPPTRPHQIARPPKAANQPTRRDNKAKRQLLKEEYYKNLPAGVLELGAEEDVAFVNEIPSNPPPTVSQVTEKTQSITTQTPHSIVNSEDIYVDDVSTQISGPPLSYEMMDDKMIAYYTGLECKEKFNLVLQSLGTAAHHLNFLYPDAVPNNSIEDQLLITLIKLRVNKANIELSMLFGVPERVVSNIFFTWVNFIYFQWGEIDWWPDQSTVRFYAPDGFKKSFPHTRLIIDGTECPISKPEKPLAQQATWSTYKNKNTTKILVGASPGGLVTYVSEAYGGSASDRAIVERSDLAERCQPGDEIMSDKGFNVEDLFIPHQVEINIPTFFKKRNCMDAGTVRKDRRIASKRVHIERLIGLAKTYAILKTPMNHTLSSISTQITTVIFWLCNFRNCIVPKHA